LNVLFVTAEVSPFAKVGGLADVAGSLPRMIRELGHDVRIVLPLYGMVDDDKRWSLDTVAEGIPVQLNGNWTELASIKRTELDGVPVYFVGHERYFRSSTTSETIYTPGIEQYLFFSEAVLLLPDIVAWVPDVVHCNDWHTGFIPVLMREKHQRRYDATGAVFTIHNLAYQGEFGIEIIDALALPRSLFVPELLETWGGVNFLKAGCVYSDRVNTVSPTYADEIETPEFGCKLEGLMVHLAANRRLSGIVNGIGPDFNPETDPFLPIRYSLEEPYGKAACRTSLLAEIGMPAMEGAPLVGAVTRLSSQKGLSLLIEACPRLFELPIQIVIQGLGDPAIAADLRQLQRDFPRHIRFLEKFDEDLAHLIYAGSDAFAMPSMFEPCGLGQMIAMRYGTIPIVRATGGLADTVHEGKNGFSFSGKSANELVATFGRAALAFQSPSVWARLVSTAMSGDYSWRTSAKRYSELYASARKEISELRFA
jgi:starch synthase